MGYYFRVVLYCSYHNKHFQHFVLPAQESRHQIAKKLFDWRRWN